MQIFLVTIQSWIGAYGFIGVFFASIAEELISPIPSSVVQMFSGVILFSGVDFSWQSIGWFLLSVSIPAAVGVTIGSLPYVWLSRKYGIAVIDRWGKWAGVTMDDIRSLESKFKKTAWDDVVFVLLRAFPVIPSIALAIYGGIIEMSWWRYILLSCIGVFIRATAIGIIGWAFGNTLESVSSGVNLFENIGLVLTIVLVGGWFVWRKSGSKNKVT